MAEITSSDLDNDRWATSDQVREHIDIPTKGEATDVESWIISATHSVQSWWKEATGGSIPDDLPETDGSDPNQFEEEHPLLNDAVALLAASETHESKAQNIRDDEEAEKKHVFLEHRAKNKFDDWKTRNDAGSSRSLSDQSADPASGRTSSLIDLGDR